jgi:hypothetical protein
MELKNTLLEEEEPGKADKDKDSSMLKKINYVIFNHVRVDVVTVMLLIVALPSTRIDTLK